MAKYSSDTVLDAPLDVIASCVQLAVCAGQPATYADATTAAPGGNMLAIVTIDAGDFVKATGDVSGRKLTVGAQTGISVSAAGTADHVALVTGASLEYVTTAPAQGVSLGGTVDTGAFDIEFEDPS